MRMPQMPLPIPPPQHAERPRGRLVVRRSSKERDDDKRLTDQTKDMILPGIRREQLARKLNDGNAAAAVGFLFQLEQQLGLPPREIFPIDPGVL